MFLACLLCVYVSSALYFDICLILFCIQPDLLHKVVNHFKTTKFVTDTLSEGDYKFMVSVVMALINRPVSQSISPLTTHNLRLSGVLKTYIKYQTYCCDSTTCLSTYAALQAVYYYYYYTGQTSLLLLSPHWLTLPLNFNNSRIWVWLVTQLNVISATGTAATGPSTSWCCVSKTCAIFLLRNPPSIVPCIIVCSGLICVISVKQEAHQLVGPGETLRQSTWKSLQWSCFKPWPNYSTLCQLYLFYALLSSIQLHFAVYPK